MYIIGGAQLKFVYMLVDFFFFFFLAGATAPPRGNVAPPLGGGGVVCHRLGSGVFMFHPPLALNSLGSKTTHPLLIVNAQESSTSQFFLMSGRCS